MERQVLNRCHQQDVQQSNVFNKHHPMHLLKIAIFQKFSFHLLPPYSIFGAAFARGEDHLGGQ